MPYHCPISCLLILVIVSSALLLPYLLGFKVFFWGEAEEKVPLDLVIFQCYDTFAFSFTIKNNQNVGKDMLVLLILWNKLQVS